MAVIREKKHVVVALDEVVGREVATCHDDIDLVADLVTVDVQWQIVNIISERVLDLAADQSQTEDNIGCKDGSRDGDPFKSLPELEWENKNVNPGDLRDSDRVGNRQGSVQNSVRSGENVIQDGDGVESLCLVDGGLKGTIVDDVANIGRGVVQNLQWHIAQGLLRLLDQLARVRLSHWETETATNSLKR